MAHTSRWPRGAGGADSVRSHNGDHHAVDGRACGRRRLAMQRRALNHEEAQLRAGPAIKRLSSSVV